MIYIGGENIVCPLGDSAEQVFDRAAGGERTVQEHTDLRVSKDPFFASRFDDHVTAVSLATASIAGSLSNLASDLRGDRTLFVLSTTKGEIDHINSEQGSLHGLMRSILDATEIEAARSIVVSNACISGLLAVVTAADLIAAGHYDHAVICGVDLVSRFTVTGFQSLFALDDKPCKPWDADRNGINLGEGSGCIVLSRDRSLFNSPFVYGGGACANDANHISGPSRTGEGLHRAIERCLENSPLKRSDIGQISAHGTATRYNDDMESIAFSRSGLDGIPTHSYKGYFGHTLGAAGVIELALLFQSVRNDTILPTMGLENPGTTKSIHVKSELLKRPTPFVMKTASGFGGCNAAAIFEYAS